VQKFSGRFRASNIEAGNLMEGLNPFAKLGAPADGEGSEFGYRDFVHAEHEFFSVSIPV
jgi:hypothetical protein